MRKRKLENGAAFCGQNVKSNFVCDKNGAACGSKTKKIKIKFENSAVMITFIL